MGKESVTINGEELVFFVERKSVKNINLRINIDKKITISLPWETEIEEAKEFIKKKYEWIKKQQEFYEKLEEQKENITFENGETVYLLGKQYKMRLSISEKNEVIINNNYIEIYLKEKHFYNKKFIKTFYYKWLSNYATNIFEEQIMKYQKKLKKYDIKTPKIEIRNMKNSWGNALLQNNKIIFNLNLIKTPICCIEYVALYELSHLKNQNDKKSFCDFMTVLMPDWKERKKILDEKFVGIIK